MGWGSLKPPHPPNVETDDVKVMLMKVMLMMMMMMMMVKLAT